MLRGDESNGSRAEPNCRSHMNEYELMYIVPTTFTEEELGTVESHVAELLQKHGATLERSARLGRLRFAYPIRHERFGHYVLARFKAERGALGPINEGLRLNQKEIVRHLIVHGEDVASDGKFNLVQFQEVLVEGGDRRRKPAPRVERLTAEEKERGKEQIKEGVAALEEGKTEAPEAEVKPISAEDLEKKIDAALEEKA